jgi:hypothetical protein
MMGVPPVGSTVWALASLVKTQPADSITAEVAIRALRARIKQPFISRQNVDPSILNN